MRAKKVLATVRFLLGPNQHKGSCPSVPKQMLTQRFASIPPAAGRHHTPLNRMSCSYQQPIAGKLFSFPFLWKVILASPVINSSRKTRASLLRDKVPSGDVTAPLREVADRYLVDLPLVSFFIQRVALGKYLGSNSIVHSTCTGVQRR